jgi:hypothetical protein
VDVPLTDDQVAVLMDRICTRKRRYGRTLARTLAERLRARGQRVSPYRCPLCAGWHVGHVPSQESVTQIAQLIRQRAYPPDRGDHAR